MLHVSAARPRMCYTAPHEHCMIPPPRLRGIDLQLGTPVPVPVPAAHTYVTIPRRRAKARRRKGSPRHLATQAHFAQRRGRSCAGAHGHCQIADNRCFSVSAYPYQTHSKPRHIKRIHLADSYRPVRTAVYVTRAHGHPQRYPEVPQLLVITPRTLGGGGWTSSLTLFFSIC